MKFLKTFNNSAALIENNQGQEEIVLGKGVGFGLKKGDPVDESKIERRFVTKDEVDQVKGFDPKTIEVTNRYFSWSNLCFRLSSMTFSILL